MKAIIAIVVVVVLLLVVLGGFGSYIGARNQMVTKNEAVKEAQAVAQAVYGWQEHFAMCGVTRGDIDLYAEQIDRPFLRDQRRELES